MADLDTITLSELEEVSELLETDTLLVERNGRIKRFTGEVGGGNSTLVVTDTSGTLNKTFNEIKTALDAGNMVVLTYSNNTSEGGKAVICMGYFFYSGESDYQVHFTLLDSSGIAQIVKYYTGELNGYPHLNSGNSGGVV